MKQTQEDLLAALRKKWKEYPDFRFGQLLFNQTRFRSGFVSSPETCPGKIDDIFFYRDADILADLRGEE